MDFPAHVPFFSQNFLRFRAGKSFLWEFPMIFLEFPRSSQKFPMIFQGISHDFLRFRGHRPGHAGGAAGLGERAAGGTMAAGPDVRTNEMF